MIRKSDLPLYLIVTVVALLIWFWAVLETRDSKSMKITVQLASSSGSNLMLSPSEFVVSAEIEGPGFALQAASRGGIRTPITLTVGVELPSEIAEPGTHTIDLVSALNEHPDFHKARVIVVSADPPTVEITVDKLIVLTATIIEPDLRGLQPEGAIVIDPPQVEILMPQNLERRFAAEGNVRAVINTAQLTRLAPGAPAQLTATLLLPDWLSSQKSVKVKPNTVAVSFSVRSNVKEIVLPTVPVQISGPFQDHDEYIVEIVEADRFLENVTVIADAALIDRVLSGEVKVLAFVHITSLDKEQGTEAKPAYFLAMLPEGGASEVKITIAGSTQPPMIHLRISPRTVTP